MALYVQFSGLMVHLAVVGCVGKLDLNRLISRQSGELFQLDDIQQHLLAWISGEGENTIYGLEKLAREHNQEARAKSQHPMRVSHATISRTIKGLLDRGYIEISKEEPYRTGQNKKYYAVNAKGWYASLAAISIDQTRAVKSLYPIVARLARNAELQRTAMLFFKIHLCLWFQWHIANGLVLSNLVNADLYRLKFQPDNDVLPISDYTDQLLLHTLSASVERLNRKPIDAVGLFYALEGLRLVLGTKFIALLSQENALGLTLTANIYINCIDRAHTHFAELDAETSDAETTSEVSDIGDTDLGVKFAQRTGGWNSLEEELKRFREYLWGIGFLENYSPLPEKEIIQLYDTDLKRILV
jgi:DNA-binding PadR family transcriptional regulator